MALPFDLLPAELQASILDLRASGVPEAVIDAFVERMLHALGVKANRVQVDVWQMEDRLAHQLGQIGDKLQADIQTQLGETNGMLMDVRSAQIEQGAAVGALRAEFHAVGEHLSDLDAWRERVEGVLISFSESRDQSLEERRRLRQDMDEANIHRAALQAKMDELTAAVERIEQALAATGE
jgi:chromosome segregation ATPase